MSARGFVLAASDLTASPKRPVSVSLRQRHKTEWVGVVVGGLLSRGMKIGGFKDEGKLLTGVYASAPVSSD